MYIFVYCWNIILVIFNTKVSFLDPEDIQIPVPWGFISG